MLVTKESKSTHTRKVNTLALSSTFIPVSFELYKNTKKLYLQSTLAGSEIQTIHYACTFKNFILSDPFNQQPCLLLKWLTF